MKEIIKLTPREATPGSVTWPVTTKAGITAAEDTLNTLNVILCCCTQF